MPRSDGYYTDELPITPPPIPGEDFSLSVPGLIRKYRGEHPLFPLAGWQDEVAAGDCITGYWDWVADNIANWEYTP